MELQKVRFEITDINEKRWNYPKILDLKFVVIYRHSI